MRAQKSDKSPTKLKSHDAAIWIAALCILYVARYTVSQSGDARVVRITHVGAVDMQLLRWTGLNGSV